jgi:hypothetical protein
VHSWRVQLPDRRWLTLGRIDEVALSDAREAAQHRRAKAALGEAIPARKPTSDITLREFLDKHYESWMKATHRGRAGQVERIRWAFKDLLDQKLSEITPAASSGGVQRAATNNVVWNHQRRRRRGRFPARP